MPRTYTQSEVDLLLQSEREKCGEHVRFASYAERQRIADAAEGLRRELISHESNSSVLHKDGWNNAIEAFLKIIKGEDVKN